MPKDFLFGDILFDSDPLATLNIELHLMNLQKVQRKQTNNMPIEIEKIIHYQPGYQSSDHENENVPTNVPRPEQIVPTSNVPIPGQSGPFIRPLSRPVLRPTLNQELQPRTYVPRRGAPVRKNVPSPPSTSLIPSRKNSRAYKGSSKCCKVLF